MNKQEMVDRLVMHTLHAPFEEAAPGRSRMREPDFAKMPERLLKRELQLRGLIDFDEPELFDEDDANDEVSADELRALVSAAPRPCRDNHFFD